MFLKEHTKTFLRVFSVFLRNIQQTKIRILLFVFYSFFLFFFGFINFVNDKKCVLQVHFGSYNFTTEAVSTSEEGAKIEATFLLISQLYKGGLIQPNKKLGPNAKRQREVRRRFLLIWSEVLYKIWPPK